jgi:nitrate/nitrite transporter NarK
MWEMFGMRAWMAAFLTACLLTAQFDFQKAVNLSAVIAGVVIVVGAISNALGGLLSDRYGRENTIVVVMLGSGLLSFLIGWTRALPFSLILIVSVLYGFMVTGESSEESADIIPEEKQIYFKKCIQQFRKY